MSTFMPVGLFLWAIVSILTTWYYVSFRPDESLRLAATVAAMAAVALIPSYFMGKYELKHNGPYKIQLTNWEVRGYFRYTDGDNVLEFERAIPLEDITSVYIRSIFGTGVDAHPDGLWVVTERTKHFRLTIENARRVKEAWQAWKAAHQAGSSTSSTIPLPENKRPIPPNP
jgi:hypothetical protein